MKKTFFILTTFLLQTLAFHAAAQIPRTLSYQGVLTDNAGQPRPDGSYSFTFRFYTSPTGGTAIWSESKSLSVKSGLFSTVLGEQTPFGAAVKFDQQYWLGIQVGNEPELSPRMALTSVGYSLGAVRADTAKIALVSLQTNNAHNCTDCNVKQIPYNAVGDGIADDRQAFVDAIANCGSIFVPAGTYRWSSGITTDRPIRLTGSSPSTSVINVEAGDGLVIGGSEVLRPTIQELTFLGRSGRGMVLTNTKGALVQHVVIAGFSGGGITINGMNSLHVSLRDVRVAGPLSIPTTSGIFCEEGTSVRIENAYVSEYETLIRTRCDGLYASGNILENGRYGYYREEGEMTSIGDWFTAIVWAYTIQKNNSIGVFHPRGYVTRDKIFVEADVDPRYLVFVLPDHGTPLTPY